MEGPRHRLLAPLLAPLLTPLLVLGSLSAATVLTGCHQTPDMSGTFTHPVAGDVQLGDQSQPLSGSWTVEVTREPGSTYAVRFQGCVLRTEAQINGVAEFAKGQECTLDLPDGVQATLRSPEGQLDHRADLVINMTLSAEGATLEDPPRQVVLRSLFPASAS